MRADELIRLKTAALLHPIPNEYLDKEKVLRPLGAGGEGVEGLEEWVGIEHILENGLPEGRGETFINMLNPSHRIRVDPSKAEEAGSRYSDELARIAEGLANLPPSLRYAALYAVYEPLWFRACGGGDSCVIPASRKLPNRTVFDVGRALATAANWVDGKGLLVRVDVAGIQGFISVARKVGDSWAGSWLVSALTWYTVAEVVKELGPDTVISPALELNPFFYSSLMKWLSDARAGQVVDAVRDVLEGAGYDGAPEQPVMPGTVYLAIPCLDDGEGLSDELREAVTSCDLGAWRLYFLKRFREGWRRVAGELIKKDEIHRDPRELGDVPEESREAFAESLNKLIDAAVEEPPLMLRVEAVTVEEALESLRETLGESEDRLLKPLMLHHAWHTLLPKKAAEEGWVSARIEYGASAGPEVLEFTKEAYDAVVRVRRCTMCGVEPGITDYIDLRKLSSWNVLKDGEVLGPYCLIKRLVAENPKSAAEALGMEWLDKKIREGLYVRRRVIIATTELAGAKAVARYLVKIAPEISWREPERDLFWIPQAVWQEIKALDPDTANRRGEYALAYTASLCLNEGAETPPVYDAIATGKEDEINKFIECASRALRIDAEKVSDALRKARKEFRRYYALVKADGDFFGSRLLRGNLGLSLKEYVTKAVETEVAAQAIEEIEKALGKLSGGGDVPTLPMTITYIKTLSRAMMAVALNDVRIIESLGGVVAYAGGDDLAAMLPTWVTRQGGEAAAVADAVIETRRAYWGWPKGFVYTPSGAPYPAPAVYGRSYGVVIAHHKDPLRSVTEVAGELEELKDEVTALGGRKDSTAVLYGRLGSVSPAEAVAEAAVLTNKGLGTGAPAEAVEVAKDIAEAVARGEYSVSLLHDLVSEDAAVAIHELARAGRAGPMIEYVIERNRALGRARDLAGEVAEKCLTNAFVVVAGEERALVNEVARAAKAIYSGRR